MRDERQVEPGIGCPKCGGATCVIYRRPIVVRLGNKAVGVYRRRRECKACGWRFTTKETPQM